MWSQEGILENVCSEGTLKTMPYVHQFGFVFVFVVHFQTEGHALQRVYLLTQQIMLKLSVLFRFNDTSITLLKYISRSLIVLRLKNTFLGVLFKYYWALSPACYQGFCGHHNRQGYWLALPFCLLHSGHPSCLPELVSSPCPSLLWNPGALATRGHIQTETLDFWLKDCFSPENGSNLHW